MFGYSASLPPQERCSHPRLSSAVNLACAILGENPATSLAELQETANTVVNSLMISANTCEETCDIGAQIDAAITTKLGE